MYDSEWDLLMEFWHELNNLQNSIVNSGNKPNPLLDQIEWWSLEDLKKSLDTIKDTENQAELNQIDHKLKQLNNKIEKLAIK